jgi:hypothetical protein
MPSDKPSARSPPASLDLLAMLEQRLEIADHLFLLRNQEGQVLLSSVSGWTSKLVRFGTPQTQIGLIRQGRHPAIPGPQVPSQYARAACS